MGNTRTQAPTAERSEVMFAGTLGDDVIVGDRYALEHPLGEGTFGAVWAAHDRVTGARVAVKLLHQDHHDSTRARTRFEREASIVRALDHPNIAAAFDVVPHDGGIALIMELVEGHTLRDEVRHRSRLGRRPSARAIGSLASELARGLAYAHAQGVVHRDLKPANVMLTPSARAVILDFGLARFLEPEDEDGRTTIGRILGTPMYMPPEQAAGEVVGPAGDAFALACVLFEAATLHHAWLRDRSGARVPVHTPVGAELRTCNAHGAIAARIAASAERLELRGLRPDLPSALIAWIDQASAVGPDDRPSIPALLAAIDPHTRLSWTPRPEVDAPHDTLPAGALDGLLERHILRPTPLDGLIEQAAPASSEPESGYGHPESDAAAPHPPSNDRVYVLIALMMATVGGLLAWLLLRAPPVELAEVSEEPPRAAIEDRRDEEPPPPRPAASPTASASPEAAARGASASPTTTAPSAVLHFSGGPFARGCIGARDPDCGADERPAARITVQPFALDRTEVTARAYAACVARGACTSADDREAHCTRGKPDLADHPINCVDAAQAAVFCRAAGGRLPTASEWEFAARGAHEGRYPWGDAAPSCVRANMGGCGGRTAPVGDRSSAADEPADLAGNVWEWTADGTPARREIRGGSFYDLPPALRASNRGWANARTRIDQLGFRCAYDVSATPPAPSPRRP